MLPLVLFLAAALALNVSPGPDMLYVISRSLEQREKGRHRVCVGNWRRNLGLHPCDCHWSFGPTSFNSNFIQRHKIRRSTIPCLPGISHVIREHREDTRDGRR